MEKDTSDRMRRKVLGLRIINGERQIQREVIHETRASNECYHQKSSLYLRISREKERFGNDQYHARGEEITALWYKQVKQDLQNFSIHGMHDRKAFRKRI